MIRAAKFADVPALMALVERATQRSQYAALTLDRVRLNKACIAAVQGGGCWVAQNSQGGALNACLAGGVERIYGVFKETAAFDALFYADAVAGAMDIVALLKSFVAWAEGKGVVEIWLMTPNVLPGNAEALCRAAGFEAHGAIYRMRVKEHV